MTTTTPKIALPKQRKKMSHAVLFWFNEYQWTLLRLVIGMGIIIGAGGLGWLATQINPLYALAGAALPMVLLSLDILLRRQYFGPMLILLISTLTSFALPKGITPALILTAACTVFWLISQMLAYKRVQLIRAAVLGPCIAWIAICVFSLFWGWGMADPILIHWDGIELIEAAQLSVLVLSPVVMLLTAHVINEEKYLFWLVMGYLLLTTYGIGAEVAHLPLRINVRGLISTWAVGLLYGQLLFNSANKTLWWKLGIVAILGVWLYRFFYAGITWLSGWLPMMVMIVVVTFFRSRKALIAMGIGAILAVFIFLPWWEGRFSNEYNESGGNRLAKWEFIFSQPFVQNHILFGTGPGGYARYFMTYFPNNAASTHSNYIDIFLQVGIVGSLIFVWMIAALAWDWWTLFSTKWKNPFLQGYYYTTIGGLAAILVAMFLGDWFTPFVFNQTLQGFSWTVQNWVFLGGMLALPEILRKQQERVENPATH